MRSRNNNYDLGRSLRRFIIWIAFFWMLYYLGQAGWSFFLHRDNFPTGTTIAGLDVSGQSAAEARDLITQTYEQPVMAMYHDEGVAIVPADVGFTMNMDGMLNEALEQTMAQPYWQRYISYVLQEPLEPITVRLKASHDPSAVRNLTEVVSGLMDKPATQPQLLTNTGFIQGGRDGYIADIDASALAIEEALYHPTNRSAQFIVTEQPSPELSLEFLKQHLEQQIETFDGIGSLYVVDLETGRINRHQRRCGHFRPQHCQNRHYDRDIPGCRWAAQFRPEKIA